MHQNQQWGDQSQHHFEYYSQRMPNPQEGPYSRDNYQDQQWEDPSQHQFDYYNHQTPQGGQSLSEQTHNELETLDTAANELHRSNRQIKNELDDIEEPESKKIHQLTDYMRRRDNTTRFANDHVRKAFVFKKLL